MSARMTPNETVEMLNEYFDEMTRIIFKHQGTVDKFMGDAVMAIFGAPFSYGDDADRAALAAIDMVRRVQEMKEAAQQTGKKAFDIGVGINTGLAIAGNVGNLDRMDYTVIGDMVNAAFRLTSIARRGQILVSKETRKAIQREMDFKDMGAVKTKDLEIEAFEVVVPPMSKNVSTLHVSESPQQDRTSQEVSR